MDVGGDLTVRRMGFGAMRITGEGIWGPPADHDACIAVLRRAVDLGVNFIDTADSYGPHVSEELIAEALHPYPEDLVIATKGGLVRPGPGVWNADGRPEHLREACEGSLRRLKLDQIPLYQFHRPDPEVPLEESVGALAALKDEGKIRHIGLSNVNEEQLHQAMQIVPIVSVQNMFSIAERSSEPVLAVCEIENIVFIPWRPVDGGTLSSGAVADIARAHDRTPTQVALAWLLDRSPAILPIPGTASVEHLEENVAAAEFRLTAEEVGTLIG
ncbi:MAG TPA: aldo/keto reductase [Acidimicrobiales bacterium]|jgi:aryl-alcohol dehydrogenase-like predicted oxidoreductase|nr:aldo/keto reductase [Acidimicrobiales bacterium]